MAMDDLDLGATLKGFIPGQKLFKRYTLTKILGRGGMGVVWLARDEELEQEVTLKFLPEIVTTDKVALDDLRRETRRSRELTHPNIVRIHDFVRDERSAAISMEYIDGDTLSNLRLERPTKVFGVEELRPWVQQLCEALAFAHEKGKVVHRDLKPANLMVNSAGDLKIADFGISASMSDSVSRVSVQAGSSGTPVYMSPQQMMGEKPAVTDDIYALGATLYELLTGKPPFYSGRIEMQVMNKLPPRVAERRAELGVSGEAIPQAWEETIAACLAKEPRDRPQSAGEVAERLELGSIATKRTRITKTEPEVGRALRSAPSVSGGTSSSQKSKTPLIAALLTGVVVLAATGYYYGVHVPEQKRHEEIARLEAEARMASDATERARLEAEARMASDATERARLEAEALKLKTQQEATAAEAARVAAARGGMIIRTNPAGAEVRVGAIALERSPLTLKNQKLGDYPVRVRLPGYEDWDGTVSVEENEFTDLNVDLVRSTGRVVLAGTTGAEVIANGRRLGVLPLTLDKVPTGEVSYAIGLKGYKSATLSGTVERGEALRLSAVLEKQTYPQAGQAWENTLGQKFVPVPGTGVLFCIWETRVQDFATFVRETGHDATADMYSLRKGSWGTHGDSWKSPGFSQDENHPVVGINEADAKAFCAWLTKKERAAGRLAANQEYRLPTDADWDAAVGKDEFPWGDQWPPPSGAGNYAGSEARDADRTSNRGTIEGYRDPYARTSPVGSFAANRYGLYDLGGNVWERVGDSGAGLRGASFIINDRGLLASSYRNSSDSRLLSIGFRVVCAVGSVR